MTALQQLIFVEEWKREEKDLLTNLQQIPQVLIRSEMGQPLKNIIIPESLFDKQSVSLPIGARTLYLSMDGHIFHRGMNKFRDINDPTISSILDRPEIRERLVPKISQRKLAGFFVAISANNNNDLFLTSKHCSDGPHVAVAKSLLENMWGPNYTHLATSLAKKLYALSAVLICEAIDLQFDPTHPVLETGFDGKLVPIALQRTDTLPELSLPLQTLSQVVSEFNFPVVPAGPLTWDSFDLLREKSRNWDALDDTEGYVAVFEIPALVVHEVVGKLPLEGTWVPLRVKVKSKLYNSRRQLRNAVENVITNGWGSVSVIWPHLDTYQRMALSWAWKERSNALTQYHSNFHAFLREFHSSIEPQRSMVDLHLTRFGAGAIHPRNHCLLLTIGLPGSGKSTFTSDLTQILQKCNVPVLYISRDEEHAKAMKTHAVRTESHLADARARRDTHRLLIRKLTTIKTNATVPTVIILDGCNASTAARRQWQLTLGAGMLVLLEFALFEPHKQGLGGSAVSCVSRGASISSEFPLSGVTSDFEPARVTEEVIQCVVAQVQQRTAHPVLKPEDGDRAVRIVADKFEAPTKEELQHLQKVADCVPVLLRVDIRTRVTGLLLEKTAQFLRKYIDGQRHRSGLPSVVGLTDPGTAIESELNILRSAGLLEAADQLVNSVTRPLSYTVLQSPPFSWEFVSHRCMALLSACVNAQGSDGQLPAGVSSCAGNRHWLASLSHLTQPLSSEYRTDAALACLHVTVLYIRCAGREFAAKQKSTALLQRLQQDDWIGSEVTVVASKLLVDINAVCLHVDEIRLAKAPDKALLPTDCPDGSLHLTLGTRSGVEPAYCATMPLRIREWVEPPNTPCTSADKPEPAGKRRRMEKRDRGRAFAVLTMAEPFVLHGVLRDVPAEH
eukprot:TRINITY_DN30648_c0_g1_i1.p1 TRINITY_DN30648_c0_g1~~TRINITY_DN30648_c0_g1_i1.p1  ORF type:complete len:901 (-),score=111.09 TRINITY_DN30648_c0_g1_i1:14-2716(-)